MDRNRVRIEKVPRTWQGREKRPGETGGKQPPSQTRNARWAEMSKDEANKSFHQHQRE